jgi:hypothetical protein
MQNYNIEKWRFDSSSTFYHNVADGNVGIGTTSPTAKLDVSGGGLSVSGWSNNNSGTSGGVEIGFDGTQGIFQVYDRVNANYEPILINGSYTMFYISGTERARFNTNGNLGIGTTSPVSKLHVKSSAGQDGIMIDAATYSEVAFRINGGATKSYLSLSSVAGGYINGSSANSLIIRNDTDIFMSADAGGTSAITIKNGGNVGIGFTAPAANLHVFGPTMIVGDSNTTQNVRQTIVGSTTGNASTTAKKIFVCGHTSTGTINVTAIITAVSTASATATFSFANAYGNSVTPNRLSYISLNSTITSIDCSYNNSGYQMEISVTYTGATAPTLYFTAEGMGSGIWTL